jgi:putative sigma-54 modulation protein
MKLKVNAVHFTADNSLVDFIQKKLNKLDHFHDRITGADVFLKLEKGDKADTHKKLLEVNLHVPGKTIFVKEEGGTFEEATDKAIDVLTRQVKKVKQKQKQKEINKTKPIIEAEVIEED